METSKKTKLLSIRCYRDSQKENKTVAFEPWLMEVKTIQRRLPNENYPANTTRERLPTDCTRRECTHEKRG